MMWVHNHIHIIHSLDTHHEKVMSYIYSPSLHAPVTGSDLPDTFIEVQAMG